MTIGWIDGTAGASGDMLLGALVDAGVDLGELQQHLDLFDLGIVLRAEAVVRSGLAATKIHVDVPETRTLRHLADIIELLDVLTPPIRDRCTATFERLARAEAAVHGTSIAEVHFHEVGALDSIADVVAVCAGFDRLGLEVLHASTLSLGSGTTRGEHGPIPIPGPAVLRLLDGIAPVAAGPATFESTTPTGAALLAEWVDVWGPLPELVVERIGVGAGTKDSDVVANVSRLVVGERVLQGPVERTRSDRMVQIEANVDDIDPRVWPHAIQAAITAGAVDAWVTPILMKKGRPAHTFSALCSPDVFDAVVGSIFRETTTIGLRHHLVERTVLDRTEAAVEVEGQTIRVKIASHDGEPVNRSVEWDDVVAAAERLGWSANEVLQNVTEIR
jgi:hypothetical protein